ncbi:MAG: transcription-repair coupling factor [bacterium]
MEGIRQQFSLDANLDALLTELKSAGLVKVGFVPAPVQAILAGWLAATMKIPVVVVKPDSLQARLSFQDVKALFPEIQVLLVVPDAQVFPKWLKVAGDEPTVMVAAEPDLATPVPEWRTAGFSLRLHLGAELALEGLINWLEDEGYERVELVTEPGEYATRGCVIDLFSENWEFPLRVELFDNVVVALREFEPLTQRSKKVMKEAVAFSRRRDRTGGVPVAALLPDNALYIGAEKTGYGQLRVVFTEENEAVIKLGYQPAPSYLGNFKLLREEIERSEQNYTVVAVSEHHRQRLQSLLGEKPHYLVGGLSAGFVNESRRWVVLTEREIYGTPVTRLIRRRFQGLPVDNLLSLRPGDYVVHIDYGVGMFAGIRRLKHTGIEKDYLVIQYAGNDRIYVPVENFGLIDRYIGADDEAPKPDRLGGRSWLLAKAKAARASAEYAKELIETYARRAIARSEPLLVDPRWLAELEASFPYEETPDQLKALLDVQQDLSRGAPMDRLICGDVGFGKTEIALRAAFQVATNCRQVALLAPTTVLCYQHWFNFRRRLEKFPLRVEMLSRFVPLEKQREIIEGLRAGTIDIVIGTHILLNPKVSWKNLGLLIIDEEQRFGVRQKERLRRLKSSLNVLTLSATPIPRTLYSALAGLKDISPIHTPPSGRREVQTEVSEWDDSLIQGYVYRELNRRGQVFFVHNEIASLCQIEKRLRRILPDVDMAVASGRLASRQLAEIYFDFAGGRYQILLSTAIIESGLDLPNVNTIIVNRADRFGLADLHQLRGRVGRSAEQAFALFLIPSRQEMSYEARKRLSALLAYSKLGAGYRLALRDMEIRGVGNLLGTEQHGHIARVGFNLYTQMLKEAIARLKGEEVLFEPKLKLEMSAFIPREYIGDAFQRIAIYKRLLGAESEDELKEMRAELQDRFGRYPLAMENLFKLALVRVRCRKQKVLQVTLKGETATIITAERTIRLEGGLTGLLEFLNQPRV